MKIANYLLLFLFIAVNANSADVPDTKPLTIQTWGTMREVLREGKSEWRFTLPQEPSHQMIALGALPGLAGEITVLNGVVHVARFEEGEIQSDTKPNETPATLLVMAEVESWSEQEMPLLADFTSLETKVRQAALKAGIDVTQPFPFVIAGQATDFSLHVIAGSCPIANPEGPPPGRYTAQTRSVTLVGFYAEGQTGKLTHHNRNSHVHVIVDGENISGHLDEISFVAGALLQLPQ